MRRSCLDGRSVITALEALGQPVTRLERGFGAVALFGLATGCFYYAWAYDPVRHGGLLTPSGGSYLGGIVASFIDQFATPGLRRLGFLLGGLMFTALSILLALGEL